MSVVKQRGLVAARPLEADIYEVRVFTADRGIRVAFAPEGQKNRVLLALHAFEKTTNQTPRKEIDVAKKRLKTGGPAAANLDTIGYTR